MRGFFGGMVTGAFVLVMAAALAGPPNGSGPQPQAEATKVADETAPTDFELSPSDLRAMIHAGDVEGVEKALTGLATEGKEGQSLIRGVYALFGERHPLTIAFTEAWLRHSLDSPLALTARGWALHAEGWALRGEGYARETTAAAMAAQMEKHKEGLALMQAALKIDPAFLPASDGVISMSHTTGQQELVEPEVARIMALRPNRWTLTLAGQALSPLWGGSEQQMKVLCRVYAPLVTDWPGYDADVCLIDGQLRGNFLDEDERQALMGRIRASDNPALEGWKDFDDTVPGETPSERLAYLDKVKTTRDLTYDEARVHDQEAAQLAVLSGEKRPLEFPAALSREVAAARKAADANPGDWPTVARYLNLTMEDREVNGTKPDRDDQWQRRITALQLLPYDQRAWASVGNWVFGMTAAEDEVAAIEAAEPYLVNAVHYSNHDTDRLTELVTPKLSLVVRSMMQGTPPVAKDRWQSVVQCPLARQLRLLLAACEAAGQGFGDCTHLPYEAQNMQDFLRDIQATGTCSSETEAPVETLLYEPVELSLPPV